MIRVFGDPFASFAWELIVSKLGIDPFSIDFIISGPPKCLEAIKIGSTTSNMGTREKIEALGVDCSLLFRSILCLLLDPERWRRHPKKGNGAL